jgi:hypothetical protein
MLRRTRDELPHHGPLLRFDVLGSLAADRPTYPLWRPLLLLNLFDNPVLQLWARYQVEPGRRIDKLFDDVEWEVLALDAGRGTRVDGPARARPGAWRSSTSVTRRLAGPRSSTCLGVPQSARIRMRECQRANRCSA